MSNSVNTHNGSSKQRRDALLDELESIRELLQDDDTALSEEELALLGDDASIPMLLPDADDPLNDDPLNDDPLNDDPLDDNIPTLANDDDIPLLTPDIPVLTNDSANIPTLTTGDDSGQIPLLADTIPQAPVRAPDALDAIRAAAAKVAANATRNRPAAAPEPATPPTLPARPAGTQNPFLPEHLRNRLRGAEPADLQQTRPATPSSAVAAETNQAAEQEQITEKSLEAELEAAILPAAIEPETGAAATAAASADSLQMLVDKTVQALLPALEQQIRQVLTDILSEQGKHLLK